MRYFIKSYLLILFLLPMVVSAKPAETFKEGVDYQVIHQSSTNTQQDKKKTEVVEFFSYGCPWCYRLEGPLKAWQKNKPKAIKFRRVPVVFNDRWRVYAKVYYVADALNVEKKISKAFFKAVQEERRSLTSEKAVTEFFVQHGVKKQEFQSVYHFSPGIDAQVMRGVQLAKAYQVSGVPAIVVGGKYRTDSAMIQGDFKKMMRLVDYLIAKLKNHR